MHELYSHSIPASPKFDKVPPKRILTLKGTELSITCLASGIPEPSITWYKNGKRVVESEMTKLNGFGLLTLKKPQTEDAGIYQCIAANKAGSLSHSTFVFLGNAAFVHGSAENTNFDQFFTVNTIRAAEMVEHNGQRVLGPKVNGPRSFKISRPWGLLKYNSRNFAQLVPRPSNFLIASLAGGFLFSPIVMATLNTINAIRAYQGVISKSFSKCGSRCSAIKWVWPIYCHAHVFKDGCMIV